MSLFEQKSLLAKLMATENMIIRQSNVATASFDILNRVLTVPILDRNLSKEIYDLFMGHECGHALWTPLEGMKQAKADKVNMSVLNVVEDSRIERKIKNKYPGIKAPFIKAYSELYERDFFETSEKNLDELNFIDRLNLHCKIGASLALNFSEEEKNLLREVENTETFEDAVEVTKKICELMADQMQEVEEIQKKKVKIVVHGASEEDFQRQEQSEGDSDEEADVEIHVDVSGENKPEENNQSGSDGNKGEEEKPGGNSAAQGDGAGRHQKIDESVIRSHTDDAYRKNESNLFSKEKNIYVYANIPKYDTKQIMDYKVMIDLMKQESYHVEPEHFTKYRRESSKVVSYLVKEFELRKNADQMKRAATAKTGELNMNRLYSYNFTEDIFKKITVMPQGKSHGLVMFLDWSGSMTKHFANTVKQLMNLVLFCKKVNIPYEVYSFIDGTVYEYNYKQTAKEGDLDINNFGLINLLSSRMSASDFTFAAAALMKMSGATTNGSRWNVRTPSFMCLSGTPLNEAVIAAMEIVPEFQKRNRLQIVNTVFLTDGEGNTLNRVYEPYNNSLMAYSKSYSHMIIRDPVTRHEEVFDKTRFYWGSFNSMAQTDCLIRLLKARTNSHVIGFFVGEVKDVAQRAEYFWKEECLTSSAAYSFKEKMKEKFRKESSLVVTSTGYDDYYVLRSNGLDTDDDEELTFKQNATTRGMVSAFSKYTGNKIASRVVLNRFIGLIS
mgnify:CR=1 FL=1